MQRVKINFIVKSLLIVLAAVVFSANSSSALELELEPSKAVREINETVRVKIYATGASSLISMGVKVSFNKDILQVDAASKNNDFASGWVMDADGEDATQGDQYTLPEVNIDNALGSVTMIGGRIMGSSTTGLSDRVLLGWIDFKAIANGSSNLFVDLGKYHSNHPDDTFDNFVNLGGNVDEPDNKGNDLGIICVTINTCSTDLNVDGVADMQDWLKFGEDWGRTDCNDPLLETCECDITGDGVCDMQDWLKFGADWGRTDCPTCDLGS